MNERTYPRRTSTSGLNIVLGLWMIASPFILAFARNPVAKWNNIAAGIAIILVALGGYSSWNVVMGVWLIASPFALGFAHAPTLLWNNVILGALVALVALWSRSTRRAAYSSGTPPP
jgi:hypothetical protein